MSRATTGRGSETTRRSWRADCRTEAASGLVIMSTSRGEVWVPERSRDRCAEQPDGYSRAPIAPRAPPRQSMRTPSSRQPANARFAHGRRPRRARTGAGVAELLREVRRVLRLGVHVDRRVDAIVALDGAEVALGDPRAVRIRRAPLVVIGRVNRAAHVSIRATTACRYRPSIRAPVAANIGRELADEPRSGPGNVAAHVSGRGARLAQCGRQLGTARAKPGLPPLEGRPVRPALGLAFRVSADEPLDRAKAWVPRAACEVRPRWRTTGIVRPAVQRRIRAPNSCVGRT
jgi:hypothetical protein